VLRPKPEFPPYLVLLRVGFALPAASLRRRCALTAPFHPYPGVAAEAVCFLWHFPSAKLEPGLPDVIRHTALRSSDFPLPPFENGESGRLVRLLSLIIILDSGLRLRASAVRFPVSGVRFRVNTLGGVGPRVLKETTRVEKSREHPTAFSVGRQLC
jgi:hypothetical protein